MKIYYRLADWLARNLLCRFGQHVLPSVILTDARWVACPRCGSQII